jgi:membrane protease YdiL (CAAX protease family)
MSTDTHIHDGVVSHIIHLFRSEQEFFAGASCAKRLPHIAIAVPLPVVIILSGVITGELLVFKHVLGNPSLSPLVRELYSYTVTVSLVVLFLWLWVRFFEQRPFHTIGLPRQAALRHYSTGFCVGMAMMLSVVSLLLLTGNIDLAARPTLSTNLGRIVGSCLLLLVAHAIQGANEELISRGWHFQVIGRRSSPWLAASLSMAVFTLLHIGARGMNALALFNLLLFGFLLILFVLKHQTIWAACGWHSAWNWTMGSVLGFKVSGQRGVNGLFEFTASGPDLITGGEYGPEGGLAATVVLLGGVLVFLLGRWRSAVSTTSQTTSAGRSPNVRSARS